MSKNYKEKFVAVYEQSAYTLIEIMVVVVILAVLTVLALSALSTSTAYSQDQKNYTRVAAIQSDLEVFRNKYGYYPTSLTPGQPLVGPDGVVISYNLPALAPSNSNCYPSYANFVYTPTDANSGYNLSFCLNRAASSSSSTIPNIITLTPRSGSSLSATACVPDCGLYPKCGGTYKEPCGGYCYNVCCTVNADCQAASSSLICSSNNCVAITYSTPCQDSFALGTHCSGGILYSTTTGLVASPSNCTSVTSCNNATKDDGNVDFKAYWDFSNVTYISSASDAADGRNNTGIMTVNGSFPAEDFCKTLNINGLSDWYLPAINELSAMGNGNSTLNYGCSAPDYMGLACTGGHSDVYYSSTQFSTSSAYAHNYDLGFDVGVTKYDLQYLIRCIRRYK